MHFLSRHEICTNKYISLQFPKEMNTRGSKTPISFFLFTQIYRVSIKGHAGEPYGSQSIGQCSLRDLCLQFEQKLEAAKTGPIHEGPLFKGLPV